VQRYLPPAVRFNEWHVPTGSVAAKHLWTMNTHLTRSNCLNAIDRPPLSSTSANTGAPATIAGDRSRAGGASAMQGRFMRLIIQAVAIDLVDDDPEADAFCLVQPE